MKAETELLTLQQAARHCGVSRTTMWRWVKAGELKSAMTAGGHNRIRSSDLLTFMALKEMAPRIRTAEKRHRILVVDDDPALVKMLLKLLGGNGWDMAAASDGFEAGVMTMKFRPHVILLDLVMPNMNGFEVCKMLKRNPDTAGIKIVAMSGFVTENNRFRMLSAGADVFLEKPLNVERVKHEIKQLLQ